MTATTPEATVDAVVIGAGHNGLVAANMLADAGWEVVVFEAADVAGGAVRSGEITAPGFRSDLFSAFYPLAAASPVIQRLGLEEHGLQWSHAPAALAHVFPDGRSAVLSRDIDRTAGSVGSFAAGDDRAWRDLVDEWLPIEQDVIAALMRPFPPVAPALRLARTLGLSGLSRTARTMLLSVRRLGEERFAGAGAPMLLAGNALHTDLSPDGAGSAAFGWLLAMLGQTHGFPVPAGGAGALIDAMAARLRSRGGELTTSAPVRDVIVEHGCAVGVRLADGRVTRARRAVLADINAQTLYDDLVGHDALPHRFVQQLRTFQWDLPTLKVDWALSAPIPWRTDGPGDAGTVHLGVDLDGLSAYAADLARGHLPEQPFIVLGQMTTADPSRSPAGTESAWGYTHLPTPRRFDFRQTQQLTAHVERIEAAIEAQAPGFGDLIQARHVFSPTDLQAANGNLIDGTINGGTAALHQQLIFRPVLGLGGASTPVERLYLASASAHPGGGVHGAPGSNAAVTALHHNGLTGPVRRRVTAGLFDRLYRE